MVQVTIMVNQKLPVMSRILISHITRRCPCLHMRLKSGWHQRCSLPMCMGRLHTRCSQHSIPFVVRARAHRRATHAFRITQLSILRLTSHRPTYHLSGMTHPPHRPVPPVVPRKQDAGGPLIRHFYHSFRRAIIRVSWAFRLTRCCDSSKRFALYFVPREDNVDRVWPYLEERHKLCTIVCPLIVHPLNG